MKVIRFSVFLFLITAAGLVNSQSDYIPDTIRFEFGSDLSMEVVSKNFHDCMEWGNVDSIYSLFIQDLNKMEGQLLSNDLSNSLNYLFTGEYRKIQVNRESSVENEISIDKNGSVLYFQEARFLMDQNELITFKSPSISGFEEIEKIDLNQLFYVSDTLTFPKGKGKNKHISSVFQVENGIIQADKTQFRTSAYDTIELGLVLGLGTVRSTFSPDIDIRMMLNLSKKGYAHNQFGLGYQALFFFPLNKNGKYDVKTDEFINLIYGRTRGSYDGNSSTHIGMKAGMMINQKSDMLLEETYKIGFFKNFGKQNPIELESGLFFSRENDISQFFPYVHIAWSW